MSVPFAMRCLLVFSVLVTGSTASRAATPEKVLETTAQLVFVETPLDDAMKFMAKQHDVNIVLGEGVDKKLPLSLKLTAKVKDLLRIALAPHGLTYKVDRDQIVIVKMPTPAEALSAKIRLRFIDTPLADAVAHLVYDHAVNIVIDDGVNKKLLLNFEGEARLKDALTQALNPHHLGYDIEEETIVIVDIAAERVLEASSEVQFIETPLEDAMLFLRDQHNLKKAIVISDGVKKELPITFSGTGKLKDLLTKALEPHDLTYKVRQGAIRIVPVERIAPEKALESRTQLNFTKTRLEDVMRSIRDRQDVRIVASPVMNNDLQISIVAEGTLRDVLAKMLEPHGLTYKVERDTIVIVKSEKQPK